MTHNSDSDPINTAWMWREQAQDEDSGGAVWGITLDVDRQQVEWFDSVGCACGGSFARQSFADYLRRGPHYGTPPADVAAEVEAALRALMG